jgi:hypothetical protein
VLTGSQQMQVGPVARREPNEIYLYLQSLLLLSGMVQLMAAFQDVLGLHPNSAIGWICHLPGPVVGLHWLISAILMQEHLTGVHLEGYWGRGGGAARAGCLRCAEVHTDM